ncbi:hypothetical protein K458DRAFT_437773 [Lentithecium fluviatile CBS 122367]|uniref:Uncharacterized protein n=1 Tax=Lentithecium fluviatile CBS 122367 TaxID=1168545 RepID=A0A6G1ICI9_9PLEO|nr:hypothetical protein K458DRAFT_437773 [Lentithecium fluviatile CBS 122367]
MTLPSLPLELLQQIAACVETVHRPSLCAFSLTSKACHRASAFLIFWQINITIHHREGLRRDVDRLVEALSRTDSARHVQRISIRGALRLNAKKMDDDEEATHQPSLNEIMIDEEATEYLRRYVVYDEPVIQKSSEDDLAWAPVVSLLHAIPHLKDLVYDCRSQFPPSLLSTLREQHPQCRLHHLTFRFRTLLWGVPYPYEMELATFPSLYRVKLTCALRDTDGDDDFNLEAMMELVAGLAPNLKEVIVLDLHPIGSWHYYRPRESWKGLPGFTGGAMGSLTSLTLKGFGHHQLPTLLQNWSRHTDFACLRHLAIWKGGLSGEAMEWVSQNHSFPRLTTLIVHLTRDDKYQERPHYSENAVSFFQAFESLEELSIHGPIDSHIMDTILSHYGQKLKKLNLRPFEERWDAVNLRVARDIPMEFTKDRILQIQAQCSVLEELAIPVKRNKSSASEAEIYRCFNEMKSLRFLFLTLDCSNWRVCRDSTYNPQFNKEDQKPVHDQYPLKRGTMKETFINCAVDEALARSIWKTISQNKTGRHLERLKLWTTGGGEYGGSMYVSFDEIIENLSRSWLIERVPRDDQEDITVKELGKDAREARDFEVAATPFPASTRSVAAAKVRAINDFAIRSRDLSNVSVVNIEVPRKDKRALIPPKPRPEALVTPNAPDAPPARLRQDKPEPATNPDAPPPRLGQQQEKPATCRRWKPRSLVRRGQLTKAKDKDNILENEYITAYHVGKGGTASVADLSGCTALFFYDANWTPSVFHIFSGEELEKSQQAAAMVNDVGRDTNGVTIKADTEEKYKNAEAGIRSVNDQIKIYPTDFYDYKSIAGTGKRFRFTTKPGGRDLEEQKYDGCSRQPQKF